MWKSVARLLAMLLLLFALSMTLPFGMALWFKETDMAAAFGVTAACAVLTSALALLFTRKTELRFQAKDGFTLVFLTWVMASFVGALPFYLSERIPSLADAVFESVSGFTTTGTSIILDVEIMPRSLIFWRAETHWLGGMGIIVLTVALLPFLGSGGIQLLKAETTGPDMERFTPRLTETARILWFIYTGLTALETLMLAAAGMSWFDAIVHAFSTIATGGFSSKNAGLAYWNSTAVVWIVSVFMVLSGLNFTLIFRLVKGKWKEVWYSSEARAYLGIVFISTVIIAASLLLSGRTTQDVRAVEAASDIGYGRPLSTAAGSVRTALFYTASVMTTTGFSAGGLELLPSLAGIVLFFLMFTGGCSGSTSGGIKVIRFVILWKQAVTELKKLIFPRGVFSVHFDHKAGRKDIVHGVAGFLYLYFVLLAACTLVVASSGLPVFRSLCVSLISLGNIGLDPGLEDAAAVFRNFPDYVKWTLSYIMIAGRLELWTALMFFSREYWR